MVPVWFELALPIGSSKRSGLAPKSSGSYFYLIALPKEEPKLFLLNFPYRLFLVHSDQVTCSLYPVETNFIYDRTVLILFKGFCRYTGGVIVHLHVRGEDPREDLLHQLG